MNVQSSFNEKRKNPRLDSNVPVKIIHADGDIVTETANISRSGVYCQVDKNIEPMTKLKINLLLPVKRSGKNTSKKISCEGVVVRTEPIVGKNRYHVAIFFNDISPKDSEIIADYIVSLLEQEREAN